MGRAWSESATPRSVGDGPTAEIAEDAAAPVVPDERALAEGTRVGRYVIAEKVGAGGHAVVYRAIDRELDRIVALKILTRELGRPIAAERRVRMLREARTMASLTHPNIVQVFDVGEVGESVYIAMEFVPGTLHTWIHATRRPWRDVLARFIEAGRGLAAAHEGGLVHRDFKPGNVLFDPDRPDRGAQVADFGLAVPRGRSYVTAASTESSRPSVLGETGRLTRTGLFVGTPTYMSPEQHTGADVDERSDQFAFCVSLFIGLFGVAPFRGRTAAELVRNVGRGAFHDPGAGHGVPRWLVSVVRRGLSASPDDRWPSMHALLRRLERGLRQRLSTAGLLGIGLAMLSGVALIDSGPSRCSGGDDERQAVWNAGRRADLARHAAQGPKFLLASWERTAPTVDAFVTRWAAVRGSACTVDDARALDRRIACLDGQLRDLDATLVAASSEDIDRRTGAIATLHGLADPAGCLDAGTEPSSPPNLVRASGAVEAELQRVAGLHDAGRYADALASGRVALDDAESLAFAPTLARARYEVGRLELVLGDGERGTELLENAYFGATEVGDGRTQTAAAVQLIRTAADRGLDPDTAERWGRQALADLERQPDPSSRATVLAAIADAASLRGDLSTALTLHRESLAMREDLEGDHRLARAASYAGLGRDHYHAGQYPEAEANLQRALELQTDALGPDHPDLAGTLNALGVVALETLRRDLALSRYERALALAEAAFGPDHPRVAPMLQNVANIVMGDDPALASAYMLRALRLQEQAYGEHHPHLAGLLVAVGNSFTALQQWEDAEAHYQRAHDLIVDAGGDPPLLPLTMLAIVHARRGEPETAIALVDRTLALDPDGEASPHEAAKRYLELSRAMWLTGFDPVRTHHLFAEFERRARGLGEHDRVLQSARWFDGVEPVGELGDAGRGPAAP